MGFKSVRFKCPHCGSPKNDVTAVVLHPKGHKIKRYRRCHGCGKAFRTTQGVEKLDLDNSLWHGKANVRSGVQNGNSYFTEQNIIDMRKHAKEGYTYTELAEILGCSRNTASRIVRRVTYKDIS